MPNLATYNNTNAVLKKHNFHFRKKYGQNFLIDTHIIDKILQAAHVDKEDFVLEIGPGIGTLTQALCENAKTVLAVEIDKDLIPILEDTLQDYDNLTLINQDVLKLNLMQVIQEQNNGRPIKVVANLPYYITTPILMELLESKLPVESITVMVQTEVAQRIQIGPGSKEYGALSLAVQYYAEPRLITHVSPGCFLPKPNVGSAVLHLQIHDTPPVSVADEQLMFRLIRASFQQRRKTLANSISNAEGLFISKEVTYRALKEMGLSESVRGEALGLVEFADLSNRLSSDTVYA
ncbi:ribosomal RNA small subunit methyltransferase A [Clostridia bacterium]|nr:ribosomal RNA small subunit methyltransferase A [Clostridia bacterium]